MPPICTAGANAYVLGYIAQSCLCALSFIHFTGVTLSDIYSNMFIKIKFHITLFLLGDIIAKSIITYAGQEALNPRTQEAMHVFGESLAGIQDYRETQV
jgi:hypothetical protein